MTLARFLEEASHLFDALDSRLGVADAAPNVALRAGAMRELVRIAGSITDLALACEPEALEDVAQLGRSLKEAFSVNSAGETLAPIAAPGARDALTYLRWRLAAIRRAGAIPIIDTNAQQVLRSLQLTLGGVAHTRHALAPEEDDDLSELSSVEREAIRNFASAALRPRDADIDAHQLSEAAAAMARDYALRLSGAPDEEGDRVQVLLRDTWQDFVRESEADVQQLGSAIAAIGRDPSSVPAQLRVVKRIAHKIKGTAPTIGLPEMTQLASYLEWTAYTYQHRPDTLPETMALTLSRFLELFDVALTATAAGDTPDAELAEAARRLYDRASGKGADSADASERPGAELEQHQQHITMGRATDAEAASARDFLLQVESTRLDALMAHLSGLTVNRGALASAHARVQSTQADMAAAITRLQEKSVYISDAYQILGTTPSGMYGALAAQAEPEAAQSAHSDDVWSALDERLGENLTDTDTALRSLTEAVADVSSLNATLSGTLVQLDQLVEAQDIAIANIQHDATRMRLAPLADLAPRLEMGAKYLAATSGKQVSFSIEGEMTELDRSLIGALADPLKQLVYNAITHGIESPEGRREAGKPIEGSVWVRAYYAGSEVVIEVGDDGQGINEHALIGRAIAIGAISHQQASALSREEALRLAFRPELSLRDHPDPLAGGGVGLDEVATAVRALKGEIMVTRSSDQGTVFQMRVPLTLTVAPAVELTIGAQTFTAPASSDIYALPHVGTNLRRIPEALGSELAAGAGHPLTLYRLTMSGSLLRESSAEGNESLRDTEIPAYSLAECLGVASAHEPSAALVASRGGKYVALLVDTIGTTRETMVRPLPPYLRRRLIRGVTIRAENGAAAMMIDTGELVDQLLIGNIHKIRPIPQRAEPQRLVESVLIVDDSITIRRALDNVLRGAGFETRLASDGYEALELMETELPRAVLLDVEMPRLNGHELLRILRSSTKYAQVRVAILTSRAGARHEQRARELGADDYLIKPCPHDTLIDAVKRLFTISETTELRS
jgi:chemosensory pili system protein ChpA (sensor histidine kinase/response regulator)